MCKVSATNLVLASPGFPKSVLKHEGELPLIATAALQILSLLHIASFLHSDAFWEISLPRQLFPAIPEQRLFFQYMKIL